MFASTTTVVGSRGTDTLVSALWITGIAVAAYMLVMWIALVLWVYRDIESRSVDQFTRTALTATVAVFNVPGLILYLALRPSEPLVESYNRHLEMEAFMHELRLDNACPSCQRNVDASFVACPYCRATLQSPCAECSRSLQQFWAICPYCSAERQVAAASPATCPAAASSLPESRPSPAPVFAHGRDVRTPVTTAS
jgi:RNA polymerase subunit RPABC4/transcription elongation factor Spt4